MQMGMVGLGRMGANMVRRLMRGGHQCVVHDRNPEAIDALAREGASPARSLDELVAGLAPPRVIWLMVPAGKATEESVAALSERLGEGDIVVEGGNGYFKDDIRRAADLAARGQHYVDVGTSGGVWGVERGYCLMVGGAPEAFARLEPLLETLAPGLEGAPRSPGREGAPGPEERGYLHCGPAGSGHYVKMVHNGIEYGLMQAYAEGFDLMHAAADERTPEGQRYHLDLPAIAELWRRGSVVGSWLLDLTASALHRAPGLESYSGHVSDSGEGRWTVQTAVEQAVPADVLSAALYARFRSRVDHTFAEKVLSAMRKGFGGHVEGGSS